MNHISAGKQLIWWNPSNFSSNNVSCTSPWQTLTKINRLIIFFCCRERRSKTVQFLVICKWGRQTEPLCNLGKNPTTIRASNKFSDRTFQPTNLRSKQDGKHRWFSLEVQTKSTQMPIQRWARAGRTYCCGADKYVDPANELCEWEQPKQYEGTKVR